MSDEYKYALVQFNPQKSVKDPSYIVICADWIVTDEKERKYFYWPAGNEQHNKIAVRDCENYDVSTWILVAMKAFVKYTDNFYEAVLYGVTLRDFCIDVFATNNLEKVFDEIFDLLNCRECSRLLHETAAFLTCSCSENYNLS